MTLENEPSINISMIINNPAPLIRKKSIDHPNGRTTERFFWQIWNKGILNDPALYFSPDNEIQADKDNKG